MSFHAKHSRRSQDTVHIHAQHRSNTLNKGTSVTPGQPAGFTRRSLGSSEEWMSLNIYKMQVKQPIVRVSLSDAVITSLTKNKLGEGGNLFGLQVPVHH